MFRQLLTPVEESLPLSLIVAALPVLAVLVLLSVVRRPAWEASLAGLVVGLLTAIGVWGLPIYRPIVRRREWFRSTPLREGRLARFAQVPSSRRETRVAPRGPDRVFSDWRGRRCRRRARGQNSARPESKRIHLTSNGAALAAA